MTGGKLLLRAAVPFVALIGGAGPGVAQCMLCPAAPVPLQAAGEAPLQITIGTALDFDRLVLNGMNGAALINPLNRTRTVSGGVSSLGALFSVGSVTVRGEPNRRVAIHLPASVALRTPGGVSATITQLTTDLPNNPRLGSDGTLRFSFGGRLDLAGGIDGDLRGDVMITVDYR